MDKYFNKVLKFNDFMKEELNIKAHIDIRLQGELFSIVCSPFNNGFYHEASSRYLEGACKKFLQGIKHQIIDCPSEISLNLKNITCKRYKEKLKEIFDGLDTINDERCVSG